MQSRIVSYTQVLPLIIAWIEAVSLFTPISIFRYGRRKMSLAQRMDSVRQKKEAFRRKMEQEDE